MNLMIVESPAKARRIAAFLGSGWRVEACLGHVRDLPDTELGVALEDDFRPSYRVLPGKGRVLKRLLRALKGAAAVYIATDPDREGEAIGWHVLELARLPAAVPVKRVVFQAVTVEAVQAAVAQPRELDVNRVEAQQARRIVDRLVGYLASPLAAKALDSSCSAGRVQSVCLRLVVERERAIETFTPETCWILALRLAADGAEFTAKLYHGKGGGSTFKTREPLDKLVGRLQTAQLWVSQAGRSVKVRQPLPPFTTASLQQAASKGLGLSPDRTMALAQLLYEQGWITYMRTDSVSIAAEAQKAARDFIASEHGADYRPPEPPTYTVKTANAQEAHEAIRPAAVKRLPQHVDGDGAALYRLIWQRFIASQMSPARYTVTGAIIFAGQTQGQPFPLEFRAQGHSLLFDGFLKVYQEPADEDEAGHDETRTLPPLQDNQLLQRVALQVEDHQTRAPARYTEAGLVQALEQRGIGRPSTFASMVTTLKDKGYVKIRQRRLVPTASGRALCDFLMAHFADVLSYDYTARLEAQLDAVAQGKLTRLALLRGFWEHFQPQLKAAASDHRARQTAKPLLLRPAEG